MSELKDLKVGDEVVLVDQNRKGARRCRIKAVGRKYFQLASKRGALFDRITGVEYDYENRSIYTISAWEKRERVREASRRLREFGVLVESRVYVSSVDKVLAIAEALAPLMAGEERGE